MLRWYSIIGRDLLMIIGIGTDIIEVNRIRDCLARHPKFEERIFTSAERAYCSSHADRVERFAGRFAAKEAVAKALGKRLSWHDVEVLSDSTGKPVVYLRNRAAEALGTGTILVSISHCKTHAIAYAIAVSD
ncbi:MAG: holo-ACP synthase [Armatimonadota bacterium]|nr:holo-ACP synthase [Armatimonadota bacterium]